MKHPERCNTIFTRTAAILNGYSILHAYTYQGVKDFYYSLHLCTHTLTRTGNTSLHSYEWNEVSVNTKHCEKTY